MKQTIISVALAAAAVAALSSCSIKVEPEFAASDADRISVTVSAADTKASFLDAESFKWVEGDQIAWVSGEDGRTFTLSDALSASQITNEGYTATFSITIPGISESDQTGFFTYNFANTGTDTGQESIQFAGASNADLPEDFTQTQAGEMNPRFIHFHSGERCVTLSKGTSSYSFKPLLCGGIFRVIPYTTEYNSESVVSVSLSSKNILGSAMYNHTKMEEPAYIGETGARVVASTTITLQTPFALTSASSVESSKGIYFSLPSSGGSGSKAAESLNGLNVTIKTDKNVYAYEYTGEIKVAEGKIRNIPVKLDAAHCLKSTVLASFDTCGEGTSEQPTWAEAGTLTALDNKGTGRWVCNSEITHSYPYSSVKFDEANEYTIAIKGVDAEDGLVMDVTNPENLKAGDKIVFYTGLYTKNDSFLSFWGAKFSFDGEKTWMDAATTTFTVFKGNVYSFLPANGNWTDFTAEYILPSDIDAAKVAVRLYCINGKNSTSKNKVTELTDEQKAKAAYRFIRTHNVASDSQYPGPTIIKTK